MKALAELPSGVEECLMLVERLDECLAHGFARLAEEQRSSLDALAAVFDGSPLGGALTEAIEAVGRSEFVPRAFLAIASARVAMLGAVHDALVAQARQAIGRDGTAAPQTTPRPSGPSSGALASVQHWLMELAIAGFRQLEETAVSPFSATLEALHADDDLAGLAVMLAGFHGELMRSMPASRLKELPAFRWGDLWSSAMVRTQQVPGPLGFRPMAGTFIPFGLDVQSHDRFVLATLYGAIDGKLARIPMGAYKVGVIDGPEVLDLLGEAAEPVLAVLSGHHTLDIKKGELRDNGDLILNSPPKVGVAAEPFEAIGRAAAMPAPPALWRHPVHIAEIVRLEPGHGLPMAEERLFQEHTIKDAAADAPELIALLRFDRGGWRYQPLCARLKKGFVMAGEDLCADRKRLKRKTADVLQERASRLLRRS